MPQKNNLNRYPTQGRVTVLTILGSLLFVSGVTLLFRGLIKSEIDVYLPAIGLILAAIFFTLCAILLKIAPFSGFKSDN